MESLLEVKDLSVRFETDRGFAYAVRDVSFSVRSGDTLAVVGESGCGKSVTAKAVLGLHDKRTTRVSGIASFKGTDLLSLPERELRSIRGSAVSMIFQDPMTSLNPTITIGDQIFESLKIHNHDKKSKAELYFRVDELLKLVGIQPKRRTDFPHQFSGGMKQRVVIAIALACNPELLIADEPTTALDVTIQAQVLELMAELKEKLDTSMIMITHDLGIVAQNCDKVAIMYAGEILEKGTVWDIFEGEKHHPYTVGLFGSIPDLEVEARRLSPIEGLMPDPTNLPTGCKFHPRCKSCMEICKTVSPEPYTVGEHVIACHLYKEEG